jgi:hypothetical protein
MRPVRTALVAGVLLALGACTTLSDKDRATLDEASKNAAQAAADARQALTQSQAAAAAAQQAQQAAQQAQQAAQAASDKADKIFQKQLRK